VELAPGAVLLPGALAIDEQRALVASCREWSKPPAGMRATRMPNGSMMSAQTVCLGWHWYPYRYSRTVDDAGGEPVKAFPTELGVLARRVAAAADPERRWWDASAYEPDLALVNFYDDAARMGLHQDRDEKSDAPVVSISLGDAGRFRLGNTENRKRPWRDVVLHSGDVLVFGGPARLAYHGVLGIDPGTGPPLGMSVGRLNITIRESGLA
jgi:alkylated DNA repair protein (DNA oxidative demethylase)